jgi:hypothetical protein
MGAEKDFRSNKQPGSGFRRKLGETFLQPAGETLSDGKITKEKGALASTYLAGDEALEYLAQVLVEAYFELRNYAKNNKSN